MVDEYEEVDGRPEPTEQIAGRFLGLLVFLAGVVMLVLTFVLAFQAFHNPRMVLPAELLRESPTTVYITLALRFVLLFIMGYLGSLIAYRGAQLFFYARKGKQRASAGD